jgi:hypothetical protein
MPRPTFALYYPGPRFLRESLIKRCLLLFDGVAVYAPARLSRRQIDAAPWIAEPLLDKGLLRVLSPREVITPTIAVFFNRVLREAATDPEVAEGLRRLGDAFEYEDYDLEEVMVYGSRGGRHIGPEFSRMVARTFTMLEAHGVATRGDIDAMRVHPAVWASTMALQVLSIAREQPAEGIEIVPITTSVDFAQQFNGVLRTIPHGLAATADLEALTIDLHDVSLSDLLGFRDEHGADYRAYMRELRVFTSTLALAESAEARRVLLTDRREEFEDRSADLLRLSRRELGRRASSVFVGAAAAVISAQSGAALAGIAALLAGVVGAVPSSGAATGGFTYLLRIRDTFVPTDEADPPDAGVRRSLFRAMDRATGVDLWPRPLRSPASRWRRQLLARVVSRLSGSDEPSAGDPPT